MIEFENVSEMQNDTLPHKAFSMVANDHMALILFKMVTCNEWSRMLRKWVFPLPNSYLKIRMGGANRKSKYLLPRT